VVKGRRTFGAGNLDIMVSACWGFISRSHNNSGRRSATTTDKQATSLDSAKTDGPSAAVADNMVADVVKQIWCAP
jgi:hypothetical protein